MIAIQLVSVRIGRTVINGVVAVPIVVGLMLVASKKQVMGSFTEGVNTRCSAGAARPSWASP